jgi:hypothetical protein
MIQSSLPLPSPEEVSLVSETPYQQLAKLKAWSGDSTLALRPYDQVVSVLISPTMSAVVLTTHKYRESGSTVTLTKRGTRMITYTLTDGRLTRNETTVWDHDFQPLIIDARWQGLTVSEYRDKLVWEAMCSRPDLRGRDYEQVQRAVAKSYNKVFGSGAWESEEA